MPGRLEGRVAIVTGGGNGIGEAIALLAADEGAFVACLDVDAAGAERAVAAIVDAGGAGMPVAVDLGDYEATDRAVREVLDATGRLDALFANAGGSRGEAVPFLELGPEVWAAMLRRNLVTAYNSSHVAARAMAVRGGGAIVFTTSQLAVVVREGLAHHAAAKGAVTQLVRGLAVDLAQHGIRVNAVAPGPTETPGNSAWFARREVVEEHQRLIPLRRVAQPAEIAPAAIHLASDEASFTTGATVLVDGGYTLR